MEIQSDSKRLLQYITQESDLTYFRWGDGTTSDDRIPVDTPTCGFFNEKCPTAPGTSDTHNPPPPDIVLHSFYD